MAYVRPSTEADVFELAPRLRAADVAEIQAAVGTPPALNLMAGFATSKACLTIVGDDGQVVAMWGVSPMLDDQLGMVWLLASDDLIKIKRPFLRESRKWVEALNEVYPALSSFVDERNTVHIRWLRWCGFTFIKRHARFGVERRPFIEFVRIK